MQPTVNNRETVDLLDYLEVVVKRKKLIAGITLAAILLSIVVSFLLPKTYVAKALILPPPSEQSMLSAMLASQAGGLSNLAGGLLGKGTSADFYVGLLASEAMKDIMIERFDLMKEFKAKYRFNAYRKLDKVANFESSKKDGIITIMVESRDPQKARDMANAYVEELGKLVARVTLSGVVQNREFYEKRLAKVKIDLGNAEENLKKFAQTNKTIQITEQARQSIEGIARLNAQLIAQEVQLAAYQNYMTDNSQEVINIKSVIAKLKAQIARYEGQNKSDSVIPSMGTVPALGQEYLRLMREFKIQETIFELMTKQYEMLKLSEAKDYTPLQLVKKALLPDQKFKPKRRNIVMVSTMTAFVGSLMLAFLLEYFARMPQERRTRYDQLVKQLYS